MVESKKILLTLILNFSFKKNLIVTGKAVYFLQVSLNILS